MTRLSYDATCSYNGFIFPDQRHVRVIAENVYDTANRSVKYVNYTVTVDCIIQPGDAPTSIIGAQVDGNLENIRSRLSKPGQMLTFIDEGFGNDLVVNPNLGGTPIDSAYGPHPKLLVWEPAGANRAAHIIWTVEFRIPECVDHTPNFRGHLCEFTYDIHWTINEGLTARHITGTIEIPANRIAGSNTNISDTIDAYREMLKFPVPEGFQRDSDISESRDKRVMEFRITDTQIDSDNPYFPGCRHMDVTHSIDSSLMSGGFRKWNCSITATIRVAEGFSRSLAWGIFFIICQSRLSKSFFGYVKSKDMDGNILTKASWHFPMRLKLTERVYKREFTFTFDYWLFSSLPMLNVVNTSGMFSPVEGSNWSMWNQSMSKAHSLRGNAGMGHTVGDDKLIDLCGGSPSDVNPSASKYPTFGNGSMFTPYAPSPVNSWLDYKNEFTVIEDNSVVVHKPTDKVTIDIVKSPSGGGNPSGGSGGTGQPQPSIPDIPSGQTPANGQPTIQIRGSGVYYASMSGYAIRGGYGIPAPTLISVGGAKAIRCGNPVWTHSTLVPSDTCPIYAAKWHVQYILDRKPNGKAAVFVTDGQPEKIL